MFETKNSSRRTLLRRIRDRMVERARRRQSGTFTADDVHTILDLTEFRGNRLSVITTLLNDSVFYNTGDSSLSARPVARSRSISEWTTRY
ncbi:hypothetical protein LCGC14_1654140 [marine sediment metagenome]|uniref:Uncharacterized protein n=1 Tax=marine sediment metagenome TaxID=412755 RepID=A0A0F9IIL4_9ZZZZ